MKLYFQENRVCSNNCVNCQATFIQYYIIYFIFWKVGFHLASQDLCHNIGWMHSTEWKYKDGILSGALRTLKNSWWSDAWLFSFLSVVDRAHFLGTCGELRKLKGWSFPHAPNFNTSHWTFLSSSWTSRKINSMLSSYTPDRCFTILTFALQDKAVSKKICWATKLQPYVIIPVGVGI